MTKHTYTTSGTCSRKITFELDDEKRVHNVVFEGGCHGNLQGIGKLVEGMPAEEIVNRCAGIRCGFKPTSCPDQLSRALREAL
ncbi:MAG: TIGR03905 family TSCPD domain-containing protein [Ruminococcaceae bacterium]|nr:TIGR03905 family TSCPD domain-containing protein [Oscillospiraceae bacterium]